MTIHSIEGLKQKAQNMTCTIVCGATESGQTMRGVSVGVQNNRVTCLYDQQTGVYLWIVNGQFVHEEDVRAFLDEGRPTAIPEGIGITAELAKFEQYRTEHLPAPAEDCKALMNLNGQWTALYSNPDSGYLRILEVLEQTIKQGHGAVPLNALSKKRDTAEGALLDVADKFMAECNRLKMN